MRVLFLSFLFAMLLTGSADAQKKESKEPKEQPRSQPPPRGTRPTRKMEERNTRYGRLYEPIPLNAAAREIQSMHPEITVETLLRDARAVQMTAPTIRQIYSVRGFSFDDADNAALYGWKQLRGKDLKPDAALSEEAFVNYVSGFGKLIIKSNPAGAFVELDGNKLSAKTEAVAWPSAGTYRIKLSMEGYEPVEDTCTVEEGKPVVFERSLKAVKRRSEKQPGKNKPQ